MCSDFLQLHCCMVQEQQALPARGLHSFCKCFLGHQRGLHACWGDVHMSGGPGKLCLAGISTLSNLMRDTVMPQLHWTPVWGKPLMPLTCREAGLSQ